MLVLYIQRCTWPSVASPAPWASYPSLYYEMTFNTEDSTMRVGLFEFFSFRRTSRIFSAARPEMGGAKRNQLSWSELCIFKMLISYIHKAYLIQYMEKHRATRSELLLCYRCPWLSPFSIAARTAAPMVEIRAWELDLNLSLTCCHFLKPQRDLDLNLSLTCHFP